MIRPLITAIIEYYLASLTWFKAKQYKHVIFALLFFLATYQLGEVITFLIDINMGIRISHFATTLLPPLGILLVQQINNRKLGYIIFQIVGIFFALSLFLYPSVLGGYTVNDFCITVYGSQHTIYKVWSYYYQFTLIVIMFFSLYFWYMNKDKKRENLFVLYSVISFDITAIFLASRFDYFQNKLTSLMCALAILAAFIYARLSLKEWPWRFNLISVFTDR